MRGGWFVVAMLAMLGAYGGGAYLIYDWSTSHMLKGLRSAVTAGKSPTISHQAKSRQRLHADHAARTIRPILGSVQVRPNGHVVIRGHAEPSSALVVLIAGRELPAVRTSDRGEWSAVVKAGLPAGSHTLGLLAQLVDRPTPIAGDLVRVDLPGGHPESTIVTYRAAGSIVPAARRKRHTLFPDRRIAQASRSSQAQRSEFPASEDTTFLHDWLRQSNETYRKAARKLSIAPISAAVEEVRSLDRRKVFSRPARVGPGFRGIVDTAWGWYGRVSQEYDFVMRRLSQRTTQIAGWQPAGLSAERSKPASELSGSSADRDKEKRRIDKVRRDAEAKTRRAADQLRIAAVEAGKAEERRRLAEAARVKEALLLKQARDARRQTEEQAHWDAGVSQAAQAKRLAAAQSADAHRRWIEARAAQARLQIKTETAKSDGRREAALRQAKIAFGIAQEAGNLIAEGKPDEGLFLATEAARQATQARELARAGPFAKAGRLAEAAARKAKAARQLAMIERDRVARKLTLAARVPVAKPQPATTAAPARVARDTRAKGRAVLRLARVQRLEAARKLEALRRGPPPLRAVAQPTPRSVVPEVDDRDLLALQKIAAEAMQLAEQARKLIDGSQSSAARWLAAEALQKAEMARKRAALRGAEAIVAQAGDAKKLAEEVARIAARRRLAYERKIADARVGPPPLSAAGAGRIAAALARAKAKPSRPSRRRAVPITRLASVTFAKPNRLRKKESTAKRKRLRTRLARLTGKRVGKRSAKRRGKRLARSSVKKWVRRSAKRKAKQHSRYRRSRRRQRFTRARWYVVRRGDSLWRIARRFLGRGDRYWAIVRANRRRVDLSNPNLIYPKQRLRIPRLRG